MSRSACWKHRRARPGAGTPRLANPRRIDDWAALRTNSLTQRLLAEEVDFGSEGGDLSFAVRRMEPR